MAIVDFPKRPETVEEMIEDFKNLCSELFSMEYEMGRKLEPSFNPKEIIEQGERLLTSLDEIADQPKEDHTAACHFALLKKYSKKLQDAKTELQQVHDLWTSEQEQSDNAVAQ